MAGVFGKRKHREVDPNPLLRWRVEHERQSQLVVGSVPSELHCLGVYIAPERRNVMIVRIERPERRCGALEPAVRGNGLIGLLNPAVRSERVPAFDIFGTRRHCQ